VVEVAVDRHGADAELVGQVLDPDRSASLDELEDLTPPTAAVEAARGLGRPDVNSSSSSGDRSAAT
jgi:hypothetical protein